MSYTVKEIFKTIQGEGGQVGRPAVFCRFAGCNLWSGREASRGQAICQFCDTDFVGTDGLNGGSFPDAENLAQIIEDVWHGSMERRLVVFTGGEPLLQLDSTLIEIIHAKKFEIAVETNGTLLAPAGIDWLCVSPKANAAFVQNSGMELKLVFPQTGMNPADFEHLDFRYFFLQPMDGPQKEDNTRRAVAYCLDHPQWRISLQAHKLMGIP
jgi:7-carboxy-7-deazaguanine synthase